jgi:UDP-glucose 4-epimerase
MERKKVVITGGAGFIGSHMVEFWVNNNAEVFIIDDLRTGFVKNIIDIDKVVFYKGSITDRKLLKKIIEGTDYIFNFAALVSVPESIIKPRECNEINVFGILNILDEAKECGVKKVVHSSSAAVYGDNPELPKLVSMKPEPKSPYGITKLDGEYYCQMYTENFGLPTVSLRYFNVFGPRQDPKSQYAAAIPIFINKALKNEPLTIYGDGTQTRDFIFVEDVIHANVLAAQNETVNGVFNIASGNSINILEIAELIIAETSSKSKIVFAGTRPGDIKYSQAYVEDSKDKLGFVPRCSLKEGLKRTISFFVQEFEKGNFAK